MIDYDISVGFVLFRLRQYSQFREQLRMGCSSVHVTASGLVYTRTNSCRQYVTTTNSHVIFIIYYYYSYLCEDYSFRI